MKRIIYILVFIFIYSGVNAQNDTGVITYERKTYWVNISAKLPWMTQEEMDRNKLTWGNRQGRWTEEYELHFNPSEGVYIEKEQEHSSGWTRREGNFVLLRDYSNKKLRDNITHLDKDYLVEGPIPGLKWKILNEIKEVSGYLCMKAMTTDPVKNVVVYAWFTDQIPVSGGPEGYGGLPGMILALEFGENEAIIEANVVNLDTMPNKVFPEKPKGKKITPEKYQEKVKKDIDKALKNKRNPFWFIRY